MEHKIDSSRVHDHIILLLLQPTQLLRSSVGTTNVTLWGETPHNGQFVFTESPLLNCSLDRSSCFSTFHTHTVPSLDERPIAKWPVDIELWVGEFRTPVQRLSTAGQVSRVRSRLTGFKLPQWRQCCKPTVNFVKPLLLSLSLCVCSCDVPERTVSPNCVM